MPGGGGHEEVICGLFTDSLVIEGEEEEDVSVAMEQHPSVM